jgi:hypothetical protein
MPGQQASVDAQAKANAPPGAPPPVGPVDTSKPVDTDLSQENAAKNSIRLGRMRTLLGGFDATNKQKTFLADGTDPRNIVVQVQIHLRGDTVSTNAVQFIENSIEELAGVPGYVIDVVFVHPTTSPATNDQPNVFEVNATTSGATDSLTWGTSAVDLTHELHHLLGLEDCYDLIDNHAGDDRMSMHERLRLFDQQMTKNRHHRPEMAQVDWDPDGVYKSVMGQNTHNKPLDSDICAVIQARNKDACQKARSTLHPPTPGASTLPSPAPPPAPAPGP